MPSPNIESHRAGHQAFNRRDFEAMTSHYADTISWTDHAQGRTFRTPQEFRDDFLAGWVAQQLMDTGIRVRGLALFSGLIKAALEMTAGGGVGVEEAGLEEESDIGAALYISLAMSTMNPG